MENATSSEHKNRLDVELHGRGLARSRSEAADLVKRGKVLVGGKVASKASLPVSSSDDIKVDIEERFVSRAGEKLALALKEFKIDPKGSLAIDVGSSTGGFVDCLLRRGASKVIAVDVGADQLDRTLRDDPRVESHESTDLRKFSLSPDESGKVTLADIIVADVSFISLTVLMERIASLVRSGGQAIFLVKPQFEVGREVAQANRGIIRDDALRMKALESVKASAIAAGFKVVGHVDSPIEGEAGNREFLLALTRK